MRIGPSAPGTVIVLVATIAPATRTAVASVLAGTEAAATAAVGAWPALFRDVDAECASIEIRAVELLDRLLRFFVG
jgi:hypothetical protein